MSIVPVDHHTAASNDTGHPGGALDAVRFAVVDVETSGLKLDRHHVLQVAVVVVDAAGRQQASYSSLVRPPRGVWSRVGPKHLHGISRWSVRSAPAPAEVLADLQPLFTDAVVTGHNVAFDVAFLRRCAERAGIHLAFPVTLCTLELSRRLDPQRQERHRLVDLSTRYGVVHDRPHDALADARATAAVLPALLRRAGVTDTPSLAAHLRHDPTQR